MFDSALCPNILTNNPGRVILSPPCQDCKLGLSSGLGIQRNLRPCFVELQRPLNFRHVRKCSTEHLFTCTCFLPQQAACQVATGHNQLESAAPSRRRITTPGL